MVREDKPRGFFYLDHRTWTVGSAPSPTPMRRRPLCMTRSSISAGPTGRSALASRRRRWGSTRAMRPPPSPGAGAARHPRRHRLSPADVRGAGGQERAAPADGRVALVAPVARSVEHWSWRRSQDQAGDRSRSPRKTGARNPTQHYQHNPPENRGICQQSGAPTEIGAPFDFNQSWATMNAIRAATQPTTTRRPLQSRTTSTRQGPWSCCRRAR